MHVYSYINMYTDIYIYIYLPLKLCTAPHLQLSHRMHECVVYVPPPGVRLSIVHLPSESGSHRAHHDIRNQNHQ